MGRPRTISDDDIRGAARAVFVERGPAASVGLVAERLGVSHTALFGRVGTKDQLLLDALSPDRPRALDLLSSAPPKEGVREELVRILLELMAFFQRVVPCLVVLRAAGHSMADLPPGDAPPPVALRMALAKWLDRAAAAGSLPCLRAPVVAEGLLGAMEARCFNNYLCGGSFAPGTDAAFVRALVEGLIGRST